ncbi:MAG: PD40 domain-containing protein, partial [Acidobacteriia bacterium]|nr:PD40 domain-containing protein [Terriglobia bacterium]
MRPALLMLLLAASSAWGQKAPFDIDAMLRLARIGEHQLSPDGKAIAFSVQTVDIEKNTKPRQIFLTPLRGGAPRPVTTEGNNSRPRWSPDSRKIAFVSSRKDGSQIWLMDANGANQKQLTTLATEADGVIWSGDGKHLLFTSEVYPDCADEPCNTKKLAADKASKVQARIYTSLLYRHWDTWQTKRRKHLFVVPAAGGAPRDLTPGNRDVPPFSLGGPDDYAVTADGKEVCFVMNTDLQPALSTNSDLFVLPIEGGEPRRITENPGADNSPLYSPDGLFLAYRSQSRAGFESDRWRLAVIDRSTGRNTTLTEGLDRPVGALSWSPDSNRIFFTAEDRGRSAIHMIPVTGGASRPVVSGSSHIDEPLFTPDGKTMV